jgi:hypothetical protein
MDEQYPKFVIDSQHARSRLAQAFESTIDSETKHRIPPVGDRTLATSPQKLDSRDARPIRDLVRLIASFVYRRSVKQLGNPKRKINGFGFLFVLAHLSEIAAAQSDNPGLWLLVGPTLL